MHILMWKISNKWRSFVIDAGFVDQEANTLIMFFPNYYSFQLFRSQCKSEWMCVKDLHHSNYYHKTLETTIKAPKHSWKWSKKPCICLHLSPLTLRYNKQDQWDNSFQRWLRSCGTIFHLTLHIKDLAQYQRIIQGLAVSRNGLDLLSCTFMQRRAAALHQPQTSSRGHLWVTYGEDSLWVALSSHVGVVDLLQDHPRLVMFPILEEKNDTKHQKMQHLAHLFLTREQFCGSGWCQNQNWNHMLLSSHFTKKVTSLPKKTLKFILRESWGKGNCHSLSSCAQF